MRTSPSLTAHPYTGWDINHTHYWSHIRNGWYAIEEIGPDEYRAEVMGQEARGRTPEEAIRNAARKSEPQPENADELDLP